MKINKLKFNRIAQINIILILFMFILLTSLKYEAYIRIVYSLYFLFNSIIYYFACLIGLHPTPKFITWEYCYTNNFGIKFLPSNFNNVIEYLKAEFLTIFNYDYFISKIDFIYNVALYLNVIIFAIIIVIMSVVLVSLSTQTKKDPGLVSKTKGLLRFEKFSNTKLLKIKNFFKEYFKYNKEHRFYFIVLLMIVLFYFNIIALIIDIIAFIFLALGNVILVPIVFYYFVLSVFSTLNYSFKGIPAFIILFLAFIILIILCWKHAQKKIDNLRKKNENFIEKRTDVTVLVVGEMNTGKDSFCTQAVMTTQRIFKKKLEEILIDYRNIFYKFDFKEYENYIDEAKKKKWITLSLQIKLLFLKIKALYINEEDVVKRESEIDRLLKLYNFPKKFIYDRNTLFNGSEPISILDMLSEYGQAYYLFNNEDPNVYSNISLRLSYKRENSEYFPSFDFDIFKENNTRNFYDRSHFSKIWNQDTFRLGMRFDELSGLSDCGIYDLSELGKERGNQFTNSGKDKSDRFPNQKNDEYNKFIKLIRHTYTIRYFPFIKVFANDQRIGSINADLFEIFGTVIKLKPVKKIKNSFPFYTLIIKPFLDAFINATNIISRSFISTRNYISIFNRFNAFINHNVYLLRSKIESNFNYKKVDMKIVTSGNEEQNVKDFFIIYKEAYAGNYATDCYFRFFEPLILKKENREFDNGVYKAKYATLEDFEKQNSLLVKDIETCPAFNPELSESEYDNKYLDIIKDACKSYPEVALKDIYTNLSRKYGKEFKNYKFFTKYVNKKKIVDTKRKKRLI